jgi:hypothetical protein
MTKRGMGFWIVIILASSLISFARSPSLVRLWSGSSSPSWGEVGALGDSFGAFNCATDVLGGVIGYWRMEIKT